MLEQMTLRPKKVGTFPKQSMELRDDHSMKVYSVTSSLQITEYGRLKSND